MKRIHAALALLALASCQSVTQADLDQIRSDIHLELASEDGLTEDELEDFLAPIQGKVDANEAVTGELRTAAKDALPAPVGSIIAAVTALAGAYGLAKREANAVDRRRDERRKLLGELIEPPPREVQRHAPPPGRHPLPPDTIGFHK